MLNQCNSLNEQKQKQPSQACDIDAEDNTIWIYDINNFLLLDMSSYSLSSTRLPLDLVQLQFDLTHLPHSIQAVNFNVN